MQEYAIVTGAGTGIGRALTIDLVENKGIKVIGVGRRLQPLQETEIYYPERIKVIPADISSEEGRQKIVQSLPPEADLRFLIHNAALLGPVVPLKEMPLHAWEKHIAVNVNAPLFLTQLLLERLEGGRVLHISSGAAHKPYQGWGAYCTSKAAFHMLYQVLRDELKSQQIAVGSVRPGVVNTPMQNEVRASDASVFPALPKFIKYRDEGQLYEPQRVARFIGHLLFDTDVEAFSEKEWDIREHEDQFQQTKDGRNPAKS